MRSLLRFYFLLQMEGNYKNLSCLAVCFLCLLHYKDKKLLSFSLAGFENYFSLFYKFSPKD